MGGFGSGRREYATTPTVEQCRHLEANKFTEAIDAPTGAYVDLSWGEQTSIRAYVENESSGEYAEALRLTYTTRPDTEDATEHEYRVPFDYTEPHFGGVRPWFECPTCGDRVGKLYLPPRGERFACRECLDLGYRSSRTSGDEMERAEQRYRKAFAKADAKNRRPHPNNTPHSPDRPKGMHHDTFEDLCDDIEAAREEWRETFHQELANIRARLTDDVDGELLG